MGGKILIKRKKAKPANKKEYVLDIVKDILAWVIITALAFVYWLAVLLILSLVLLNVWHVTFDELLSYSLVLMIITSVVYLGRMLYKRVH